MNTGRKTALERQKATSLVVDSLQLDSDLATVPITYERPSIALRSKAFCRFTFLPMDHGLGTRAPGNSIHPYVCLTLYNLWVIPMEELPYF